MESWACSREKETGMAAKRKVKEKTNDVVTDLQNTARKYESVVQEITKQYREFTLGRIDSEGRAKDKIVRIRFPDLEADAEAGDIYQLVYGEMIDDPKRKTEDEILRIMEKRGVWTKEHEKRTEVVRDKVNWLTNQLLYHRENLTTAEMEKLSEQYKEMKEELNELIQKKYNITQNSIEGRANEAKLRAQIVRSVFWVDDDGSEKRIWASDEALANEKDRILSNRIISECMTFWNGVPSSFLEGLPEKESGKSDTQLPEIQDKPSSKSPSPSGEKQD